MQYSNNFKNLLFDLRSDVNYTAWVIIYILKIFNSYNRKNAFKDYRKIAFLMQFIFHDVDAMILVKFLKNEKIDDYESQIISSCYFSSKMEERTVNTALILLEHKGFIKFCKTLKSSNIYFTSLELSDKYPVLESIERNLYNLSNVKDKLYQTDYDSIVKKISLLRGDKTNA